LVIDLFKVGVATADIQVEGSKYRIELLGGADNPRFINIVE
jgi:hypothetical protein